MCLVKTVRTGPSETSEVDAMLVVFGRRQLGLGF